MINILFYAIKYIIKGIAVFPEVVKETGDICFIGFINLCAKFFGEL